MFVIVAQWYAKAGQEDHVASLVKEMIPHARAEKGCRLFMVNRAVDDPRRFVLYEQMRIGDGPLTYPLPWADDERSSFVETTERYAELGAQEQFVLTVSESGFGKRSSAYEYRVTGRGGSGIVAMAMTKKNARIAASFPVETTDQLMLITDAGQTIRVPVSQIRQAGRATQGVIVFRLSEGERVVSVERIGEAQEIEGTEQEGTGDGA